MRGESERQSDGQQPNVEDPYSVRTKPLNRILSGAKSVVSFKEESGALSKRDYLLKPRGSILKIKRDISSGIRSQPSGEIEQGKSPYSSN